MSIASGINGFFQNFDFKKFAKAINGWVYGIEDTVLTALKNISWSDVLKGGVDFLTELDLDTVVIAIGAFKWMHGGKEIATGVLKNLLAKEISTGIGDKTIPISKAISISITTAVIGFKVGNWIYENTSFSKFADAVAKWMVDKNGNVSIGKALTVTLGSLGVSIGAVKLGDKLISLLKGKLVTAASTAATEAAAEIGTKSIGKTIGTKLGAVALAGLAGYGLGTLLYKMFSDEIDDAVAKTIDKIKKIGSWNPSDPTDTGDADYASIYHRA